MTSDQANPDEPDDMPDEAAMMLANEAQHAGHLANGSSAHTLAEHVNFEDQNLIPFPNLGGWVFFNLPSHWNHNPLLNLSLNP